MNDPRFHLCMTRLDPDHFGTRAAMPLRKPLSENWKPDMTSDKMSNKIASGDSQLKCQQSHRPLWPGAKEWMKRCMLCYSQLCESVSSCMQKRVDSAVFRVGYAALECSILKRCGWLVSCVPEEVHERGKIIKYFYAI